MWASNPNSIERRREWVFLILAGLFLGSLTMLNILGVSRFIDLSFDVFGVKIPFTLAVGVLPYPITFLCTDFVSEIYGKRRANMLVWVGFILNVWIFIILYFGGHLNPPESYDSSTWLPSLEERSYPFYAIRKMTFGAVWASMLAYLTAQFVDVQIFHWLKEKTKGKKLWLRNNASTLVSQLVDSICVIFITHYFAYALTPFEGHNMLTSLWFYVLFSYLFKLTTALIDTVPFYLGTNYLKKYLKMQETYEANE